MSIEIVRFHGGELHKRAIDPQVAQQQAGYVLQLANTHLSFPHVDGLFYPAQVDGTPLKNTKKAWVRRSIDASHMEVSTLTGSFGEVGELARLITAFSDTTAAEAEISNSNSLVQISQPRSIMPFHDDAGYVTDIYTLAGNGVYITYDGKKIVDRIHVGPGDMIRSDDSTSHSVENTNWKQERVIMAQTVRVSQVAVLD